MKFTSAELAEIRSAFRRRIRTEPAPKRVSRSHGPGGYCHWPESPDYEDGTILRSLQVAELLEVTPRTVRRWADAETLPSFRTVGGQRRFRWGDLRDGVPHSAAIDGLFAPDLYNHAFLMNEDRQVHLHVVPRY